MNKLNPPAKDKLIAANGQSLKCIGTLPCIITYGNRTAQDVLHVCHKIEQCLLAWYTCRNLGILPPNYPEPIELTEENNRSISGIVIPSQRLEFTISQSPSPNELDRMKQTLLDKYKDVFKSDGQLHEMSGTPMKIFLRENATPFALSSPRQIPFSYRNLVKDELHKQVKAGVIAPVTEPTDWVHPLVVIPKPNGGIRLCVDFQKLNQHVRRPYYPTKTPSEAVSNINPSSKYFTTFDAKNGYWQVPLEKESQLLTTFITPYGRYKFLRAPMGLASSQDEYCSRGDTAIQGIERVEKVVDDILIYNSSAQEHLSNVVKVLDRCRKHRITLNPKKFNFMRPSVEYVGYLVGSEGVQADPKKIEAISQFPSPTNLTELRSFMGLANQLGGFTNKLSEAAELLRGLMKPKNAFVWTPMHDNAFHEVKRILCSPPVLAPFDPKLPTMLQTDASRLKGLGFVLMQRHGDNWKLTQAGSRFTTEIESRYAMIKLELLAVVWAVKKCYIYLQGLPFFEIVVDHKPLESILNSQTLDMIDNPRIQRLKEKLSGYVFHVSWRRGKDHAIPDALSRAPCKDPEPLDVITEDTKIFLERKVSAIFQGGEQGEERGQHLIDPILQEIKESTESDEASQELIKALQNDFANSRLHSSIKHYKKLKDQLSVEDGLILLDSHRIVIPQAKRREILAKLHSSHQGIERTKRRARQTVYWPGINNDIQNVVEACNACQKNLPSLQKEPMMSDPPPSRPFEDVSADLFCYAGKSYMVYVDRLSGWIKIAEFRQEPSSQQVISTIRRYFVDAGVPVRIRTDGGPQFAFNKFRQFLLRWGVNHALSTPHYPQSNGHAESAVKAMKSLVAKSAESGDIDSDEFCEGLLEWLNTPKAAGLSPAEILYGHSLRSIIPTKMCSYKQIWKEKFDKWDSNVVDSKRKEKDRYDFGAKPLNQLQIGQKVRIQDPNSKKWDRVGHIVGIGRNRDYHVKLPCGRVYWRNRRFMRPVAPTETTAESPDRGSTAESYGPVVFSSDARANEGPVPDSTAESVLTDQNAASNCDVIAARTKPSVRFSDVVHTQHIPRRSNRKTRRNFSYLREFVK